MNIPHPITYQNELINKALEVAGSKKQLAKDLKITKSYVSRIIPGGDRMLSGTLMIKFYDYCEIAEFTGKGRAFAATKISEQGEVQ